MADYLVLARKYRSTTFSEVVGQEHIASTLTNAIAGGRIAHAFLFTGTRGVGKTTMARILAKALNCLSSDGPTTTPCNTCDSCVSIARGDDVDVMEIDGASNNGVDDIRELRSNAIYRPSRSRYKIYYIDEVHQVTSNAFNALLKTLEEPPPHVKFIFATTEIEKVPATIISRCQRFDFRDIPTARIADHLRVLCKAEKVNVDDGAIFRISRAAAGSMRDALSLLDQLIAAGAGTVTEADVLRVLGRPGDEQTAAIVAAVAASDPAGALKELDALLASGVTLESGVLALGDMFRHMMLISVCGPGSDLVELPESQRASVAELARKFTLPALVGAITACQQASRNLKGIASGRGLLEATVVRLAAAEKFVDAASLVQRLEQLASTPAGPARPGGAAPAPTYPRSTYGPPADQKKKDDLTSPQGWHGQPPPNVASRPASGPSSVRDPVASRCASGPSAVHPSPVGAAVRMSPEGTTENSRGWSAAEPPESGRNVSSPEGATESSTPTRAKNPDYIGTLPVAPNYVASRPASGPSAVQAPDSLASDSPTAFDAFTELPWTLEDLQANWSSAVQALSQRGHGQQAGLLLPAKVLGLDGSKIRLGYPASHDSLRRRAEETASGVERVLAELFSRPIRCEYIASGEAAPAGTPAPAVHSAISSAERLELNGDPAVKAVLQLFDGRIVNVQRHSEPQRDEGDEKE